MARMLGRRRRARAPRPRRGPRRSAIARGPRKSFNQPEWASCTEVISQQLLTTNIMYGPNINQLAQFRRAVQIGGGYQEYRITGVKFKFTPRFDTFPATTDLAQAISVPYMYHMVDRAGVIKPGASLAQLKSMGATPKRFDDKTLTVAYKPSVLNSVESTLAGAVNYTRPMISPWLATMNDPTSPLYNPSTVQHRGLWFILDAKGLPGDATYEYDVDIEVNFQFRKPLFPSSASEQATLQGGNVIPLKSD